MMVLDAPEVPAPLDSILADFAERGIRPTWLNVIHAALERGYPEDFAVVLADAAERRQEDLAMKAEKAGAS